MKKFSNFFTFVIFLCLYSAVNAGMDYIDFTLQTADAWHLLKYFDRLFLLCIGAILATIPSEEYVRLKWFGVFILIGFIIFVKLAIWDGVYYGLRNELTWFNNNCHISTGIMWLDRFLGFHMP